jgi:2-(3-amino-3-carboxypropyl)histidine synthase
MKLINIPFFYKKKISLPKGLLQSLPEKIMLFTTVQYVKQIPLIKGQLKAKGKNVFLRQLRHCKEEGQILGCNISRLTGDFDAFLYIGEGEFHPKALIQSNEKDVFCFNPISKSYYSLKYNEEASKRRNTGLAKFLISKNVGVLFTIKPGQFGNFSLNKLKSKFKDKHFYLFINDTYNFQDLEDFTFVDCFLNTACPRIGVDDSRNSPKPIINISDVIDL